MRAQKGNMCYIITLTDCGTSWTLEDVELVDEEYWWPGISKYMLTLCGWM